jgi:hypothetical protein
MELAADAPASGSIAMLFTEIEGSTRLAASLGDDWAGVLDVHHEIVGPLCALTAAGWPAYVAELLVRMGFHIGEVERRAHGCAGLEPRRSLSGVAEPRLVVGRGGRCARRPRA